MYEKTTKSLVKDILVGFNATVFAYGATGSGKTHTMVGHGGETGIMVRAISDLFDIVSKNAYRYTVSEYNNTITQLGLEIRGTFFFMLVYTIYKQMLDKNMCGITIDVVGLNGETTH